LEFAFIHQALVGVVSFPKALLQTVVTGLVKHFLATGQKWQK